MLQACNVRIVFGIWSLGLLGALCVVAFYAFGKTWGREIRGEGRGVDGGTGSGAACGGPCNEEVTALLKAFRLLSRTISFLS
jgi:hypothetical protein